MSSPEDQLDTAVYLQNPCALLDVLMGGFGHEASKTRPLVNQVHNDWTFSNYHPGDIYRMNNPQRDF